MAFALDTQNADLAFGLFCQLPIYGFQVNERGRLRSDPATCVARCHRASRFRGRAHVRRLRRLEAGRRARTPWGCATRPLPWNNASAPPSAHALASGRRNFGESSPRPRAQSTKRSTSSSTPPPAPAPTTSPHWPRSTSVSAAHVLSYSDPATARATRHAKASRSPAKPARPSQSATTSSVSPRPSPRDDPDQARALLDRSPPTRDHARLREPPRAPRCRLLRRPSRRMADRARASPAACSHHHSRSGAFGLV